jgi:hypothetical protein
MCFYHIVNLVSHSFILVGNCAFSIEKKCRYCDYLNKQEKLAKLVQLYQLGSFRKLCGFHNQK